MNAEITDAHYEQQRTLRKQTEELIGQMTDMFELNHIEQVWEERMKALAAECLKPGSDEEINAWNGGLGALNYIWGLGGDRVCASDQVYHASALDYYLGRKVSHAWGVGILVRFVTEKEHANLLPEEKEAFKDGLVISNVLRARDRHHGIALDYPCHCGRETYKMYAIPGVHHGGFAYLIWEENDAYLDVRNQCMVCDVCGPTLEGRSQP